MVICFGWEKTGNNNYTLKNTDGKTVAGIYPDLYTLYFISWIIIDLRGTRHRSIRKAKLAAIELLSIKVNIIGNECELPLARGQWFSWQEIIDV